MNNCLYKNMKNSNPKRNDYNAHQMIFSRIRTIHSDDS